MAGLRFSRLVELAKELVPARGPAVLAWGRLAVETVIRHRYGSLDGGPGREGGDGGLIGGNLSRSCMIVGPLVDDGKQASGRLGRAYRAPAARNGSCRQRGRDAWRAVEGQRHQSTRVRRGFFPAVPAVAEPGRSKPPRVGTERGRVFTSKGLFPSGVRADRGGWAMARRDGASCWGRPGKESSKPPWGQKGDLSESSERSRSGGYLGQRVA